VRERSQDGNEKTMKKTSKTNKQRPRDRDYMRAEYQLDYNKARPNRFAGRIDKKQLVVILDQDISEVFPTPESVNAALRALISAIPKTPKPRKTA
jgi:hypothetical protein